jgi:hypothetical protein
MDFIPGLPKTKEGLNNILVVVDKLTKFAIFIATNTTISDKDTAELIFKNVISIFGLPRQFITDRDTKWAFTFWEEICRQCQVKRALTTSHHPQADGQTEVMNQILETALRSFVNKDRNNWNEYLHQFALSYNSTPHTATGYAPAELLFGFVPTTASKLLSQIAQPPSTNFDLDTLTPGSTTKADIINLEADKLLDKLEAFRRHAKDSLTFAQTTQQRSYNKNRIPMEFEVGDWVLIDPHSMRLLGDESGQGKKLMMKYEGPFEIQDKLSPVTYRLRLSSNYKFHPVINIEHLEPYLGSPPELGDRSKVGVRRDVKTVPLPTSEIEKITDERIVRVGGRNQRQFRVRFIGEDDSVQHWRLERDIQAPELMRQFKATRNTRSLEQPSTAR